LQPGQHAEKQAEQDEGIGIPALHRGVQDGLHHHETEEAPPHKLPAAHCVAHDVCRSFAAGEVYAMIRMPVADGVRVLPVSDLGCRVRTCRRGHVGSAGGTATHESSDACTMLIRRSRPRGRALRAFSSVGRAPRLHRGCHRFEPGRAHQNKSRSEST
jgi:hypothetical protein